jgi:hypothetical protein
MEWEDNCPKPWLGEETLGTCSNIMECRTLKLINYFNISKWAPNVEVMPASQPSMVLGTTALVI